MPWITCRGVVYPHQCDAMGHLTVKEYLHFFDQAEWGMFHDLGYETAWIKQLAMGWADVRHELDYKYELVAGDIVHVETAIEASGRTSISALHRLYRSDDRIECATLRSKSVQFDMVHRKSIPIHSKIEKLIKQRLSGSVS